MITHAISVTSAIVKSLRYARRLRISAKEMPRYLRKSFNLALCYTGLISRRNYPQSASAGRAAFLSCAYDVVTDWRDFREKDVRSFEHILRVEVPNDLRVMAMELLSRDRREVLSDDGLERGVTSVRFVTGLIGSRSHFEKLTDLNRLGMALQIVDDVLDYEADTHAGDTNCLCSSRREEYLKLLAETLPEFELVRLFPQGKILRYVVKVGNIKARILSTSYRTSFQDVSTKGGNSPS
jgi:hypothetical protein